MRKTLSNLSSIIVLALLLIAGITGCSNNSPLSPSVSQNDTESGAVFSNVQQPVNDPNSTPVATLYVSYASEAVDPTLETEFTGLIVGVDAENNIINLMHMTTFEPWIGHVTDETVLIGLLGEDVNLADFGVCSAADARGDEIGPNELNLNYLKMKNF